MIGRLRGTIERVLPDGCPFVIGGGLIRDALYGGRPNDIDIWLPSNIHVPDVDAFCSHMIRSGYGPQQGFQGQVIFRGPGANVQEVTEGVLGGFGDAENDAAGYGDVHNHWVVEIQSTSETIGHPRINIMRNMARWTGDAPSWFTEIMRNFDLDICMYFVGYMPGQNTVNTVIMPEHLRDSLLRNRQEGRARVAPTRMNEVYWNQARLDTTSVDRIISRVRKMNEKYLVNITERIENIPVIATLDIIAVPVRLADIIGCFNCDSGRGNVQLPQRANRIQQADYDRAWVSAQEQFRTWREGWLARGGVPSPTITPMAFLRIPA